MESNEELQLAWDFVEKTGANVFLTGKAGTGKTTFLRTLRDNSPKRMVVLAPTGIAAINAGGVTIHSFFQLPLSPYVPGMSFAGKEQKRYQFNKMKRDIIRTLDLLVIDEISMVRADLLDAVDSVMRRYRNHRLPFGGAQLLLIGDLQQLAPVAKEDEWELLKRHYTTPYFFSSKALNMTPYQTIELRQVYRQQDGEFIALLNKIRENKADDNTLAQLNQRYRPNFTPPAGSDYIRLTTHNHQAQQINDHQLSLLRGKEQTYKAEVEGVFPEYSYPADESLTLKVGAQVMFIKNDAEKRFYNGMIGEVTHCDKNMVKVMSRDTNMEIELTLAEWTNAKYTLNEKTKEIEESIEGVYRQFPLRLAWAITIHKSQGLTFEHAIIDVSHSFAHGQTYVALSRCKSLKGMVLSSPLSRSAVISDHTVSAFIRQMEQNKPTGETLSLMQRMYIRQTLNELFDLEPLYQTLDQMVRLLSEHFYQKCHTLLAKYHKEQKALQAAIDVAKRFEAQYTNILATNANEDNAQLQERIHKAAEYFLEQIKPIKRLHEITSVATNNKQVSAQFMERKQQIADELKLKTCLLMYESAPNVTFSTNDYLYRKARVILANEQTEKKKRVKGVKRS